MMDTPDATLARMPAEAAPGEPIPQAEEEEPASRRKKILLLLLLLVLLVLSLISAWYLLFRKPLTELPNPIVDAAMPTYAGSLYGMSKPQGVAVTSDGSRIIVTQTGTSLDTMLLDQQGNKLAVLQPPLNLIAQAHQLYAAINPVTGQVWTTDRFNGAVAIYGLDGTFVALFDQGAERANWQPLGIGFDKTGNVYVADVSNGAAVIDVFGPDGKFVRSFGSSSSLDHPNGIAVADDGTVYLTDTGNGRMQVFDAGGNRTGLVSRGDAEGNLGLPVGIAFDDQGRVLVADSSASRVQAYAQIVAGESGPRYINAFGEKGSGDANFSFPNGLAADGRGRIYVADWGNDRLEIWSY
jgi:DNA-binding beta-propeller fold protein YncE